MTQGDITENDIIDELLAIRRAEVIQPGEFTIGQYAERAGVTYNSAVGELRKMASAGLVTCRKAINAEGRQCWVYKKAAKT